MNVCSLYSHSRDTLNDLLFSAVNEALRKLEPTRMDLLGTIGEYVFLRPERVFWLYGLAGSGKSTISTTIATFFQEQKRLGAFLFCNRDVAERTKESARLPPFIHFVITSRAENDIRTAFMAQPHVIVHEDRHFFRAQFHSGNDRMSGRSGLASCCEVMPELALDALYKTTLEATGVLDDEEHCSDSRAIMGIILVAREPISYTTIDALLPLDSLSLHTIQKLGCVLRWSETNPTEPVRLLHPSFSDFLAKRPRCNLEALHIDAAIHHKNIAIGCIRHLDGVLKKNISDLVLSTTPVEVTHFPAVTAYASVRWVDYVYSITAVPDDLPYLLEQFLFRHVLHWLKVMSLLHKETETDNYIDEPTPQLVAGTPIVSK
ncbi:hypothetical protein PILCRDRAFT_11938 [Piloderma croceum F 1598]|uniref:Nephrocystin 3-like N-terminal domain-containing protein n=1 Tax=Piloderma croceum (strain F 1598) TaxID=765440 RepID=A0A0C3AU72_PILCF|nr:hypothetical protein PILCRDRAFT_11938 [Piloderma croceum F 1598]